MSDTKHDAPTNSGGTEPEPSAARLGFCGHTFITPNGPMNVRGIWLVGLSDDDVMSDDETGPMADEGELYEHVTGIEFLMTAVMIKTDEPSEYVINTTGLVHEWDPETKRHEEIPGAFMELSDDYKYVRLVAAEPQPH